LFERILQTTKVWDKNSHGALDFSIADDDSTHLGHIIENDCIQSAMYMALADTKVEFISAKLDDINKTKQGYCLNLNDEQQLQCSLLIGADGARSRVRDLAGIEFSENGCALNALNRHLLLKNPERHANFYPIP
jgi:2-octaprenyl-3-methyl-6-methoxy-1,4-benzoquinol hydroxylase/2-octaprenylphenol hydroxylase